MRGERDWARPMVRMLKQGWQLLAGLSAGEAHRAGAAPGPRDSDGDDALESAKGQLTGQSAVVSTLAESAPPWESTQPTAIDGYAAVRDGHIEIVNPIGGGLLAVLIPSSNVILNIDGHEVKDPISVWAGQRVTVGPRRPSEPVRRYQIEVDPDRMAAWLTLPALAPLGHRVLDAGPAHVVRLEAQAVPGYQANPTPEEIEQGLASAGVVVGIDRTAILRALEATEAVKVRVAAGEPVRPSRPGRLETTVQSPTAKDPRPLSVRVEPGQSLARVIPPQLGECGYDVTGRHLEPEAEREVRLTAGAGAVLTHHGTEAVATIAGRPVLFELEPGEFRVSVIPVTEIRGPLIPDPAPHQFAGDVVIRGDLHEGTRLQAGGWIWVQGSVQGSALEAGQGIRVDRNVRHSSLSAKSGRRMLTALLQESNRILAALEQLRDYADQIIRHPRYSELSRSKSLGEVMRLLAQNRFRYLRQGIGQVRKILADLAFLQTKVELEAVLNMLEQRVYSGNLNAVDDLTQLIDGFRAAVQRTSDVHSAVGPEASVHAHTLLWSKIEADGDVVVHGRGAEYSTVTARGRVDVPYLRNSSVKSLTAVAVGIAASSEGDRTVLEVSAGGEIRLGQAVTPVHLHVANWHHRLPPESRGVHVQSDRDGRVKLTADGAHDNGQPGVPPVLVSGTYHPLQKH